MHVLFATNMDAPSSCQIMTKWTYSTYFVFLFTMVYTSSIPQCPSGAFTSKGECCDQCAPGYGVITSCGHNNTICQPCNDDVSYSPEWSHTSSCKLCSRCQRNEYVKQLCNSSQDTICECKRDYFRDADGTCSQCNMCPPGFGVVVECTSRMDSQCSECTNRTYSTETSATAFCKPCKMCPEGSTVIQQCTTFSDTLCSGTYKDLVSSTGQPAASTDPTVILTPRNPKSFSVVPIYCVLLGAVVVGLMIYVIFKRWSFSKVKLRNQKMIRSNTNNSIVGKDAIVETGITKSPKSVKSNGGLPSISDRSLQSSRIPLMAVPSTTLYRELIPEKRMEIEMPLGSTRIDRRDWRGLAEKLGFSEQDVMHFIKTCDTALPVQRMLEAWSQNDAATLGALVTALHSINRIDVVDKIPISTYT